MIHTLGPAGTFSDKAATILDQHLPAREGKTFVADVPGVFDRVLGEDSWGVVPIENSLAGTVDLVQELLVRYPVRIEYEIQVPIAFKLLFRGAVERVTTVFVHPVAERQCARVLASTVPGATTVFTRSNTDSADRLVAAPDADVAAVIPLDYPAPAGLACVDLPTATHNTTRFAAIRRGPVEHPDLTRAKLSLLIAPHANRAGLLYDILGSFKRNDLSLSRIDSYPVGGPWEYQFFLDVLLGPGAPAMWQELKRGDWDLRVLGCYSILRA